MLAVPLPQLQSHIQFVFVNDYVFVYTNAFIGCWCGSRRQRDRCCESHRIATARTPTHTQVIACRINRTVFACGWLWTQIRLCQLKRRPAMQYTVGECERKRRVYVFAYYSVSLFECLNSNCSYRFGSLLWIKVICGSCCVGRILLMLCVLRERWTRFCRRAGERESHAARVAAIRNSKWTFGDD